MTSVTYRAVIMDYAGSGERVFEFAAGEDFFQQTADEIIEGMVARIGESEGLKTPLRYELNAAKRYPDKNLVCAIGAFLLTDKSQSPFIAMIGPAQP